MANTYPQLVAFDLDYTLWDLWIDTHVRYGGKEVKAREALNLLLVPPSKAEPGEAPKPAIEYFDELEIYPGSKVSHFRELHKRTKIPYSQMLFFDDERRNKEVEKLGVTFILAPHGLDEKLFETGLNEWRRRHPVLEFEEPTGTED
ncbi:magnesium-dependent phosphatase-1 [Sanghuangporus baumii]|uniref:Magnesium-dependent phosphatase-1 n=1 Tax=Sanghuangporus baumii TaxID=108892 RepID=A0A9Q5I2Z5_SANBA|nr:magnesium-dependent phosphatase-1 [Sanghuangporus baumii]